MFSSFSIAAGVFSQGNKSLGKGIGISGRLYLVHGREAKRRKMADFDCFGET